MTTSQGVYIYIYIYILIGNIFTSEKIFPNTLESSVTKSMVGHERSVTRSALGVIRYQGVVREPTLIRYLP